MASVLYKLHLSKSVELEQEVLERPTDGHCFPLSSDSIPRGVPADCVDTCVRVHAIVFGFNLQLEPLCSGKTNLREVRRRCRCLEVFDWWNPIIGVFLF